MLSDKELRHLITDHGLVIGFDGPTALESKAVYLAGEVLNLRKEVRRLKRGQISGEAEKLRCGIEALSNCAEVNRDGQRLLSDLLDRVAARDSLRWLEANDKRKQVVVEIERGEISVAVVKRKKGGR